jgi:hypothetical protein
MEYEYSMTHSLLSALSRLLRMYEACLTASLARGFLAQDTSEALRGDMQINIFAPNEPHSPNFKM